MRLIFAGTPEFAATALSTLIAANHEIALVLTQPDRPAGRGMRETPSPVKRLAQQHGIKVSQPLSLKTPEAQATIAAVNGDTMIVAAYGLILPQAVLNIPRLGCINIHGSLLPRWRGAAPIHRSILAGDRETGITIMQMEAGLDTGPMLLWESTPIAASDTTASLHDKLAYLGGKLIVRALDQLRHDNLPATAQPHDGVTYAEKISKAEALIDWNSSADEIERKVRAFNPFPVAQTRWQGETLRIWKAGFSSTENHPPASIIVIEKDRIIVACGSGTLALTELQRAGGKRLAAREFLQGAAIKTGDRFGD